jgi:hypothetical protein
VAPTSGRPAARDRPYAIFGPIRVHRRPNRHARPPRVLELVERFNRKADEYRAVIFNETNLRMQVIDPMFQALDWCAAAVIEKISISSYADEFYEKSVRDAVASIALSIAGRLELSAMSERRFAPQF